MMDARLVFPEPFLPGVDDIVVLRYNATILQ